MTFNPDSQNAGGRKAIVDYMTNHYASLFNAKPVVNSREKPHAHVDAKKAKKHSTPDQLPEQMEGFRRAKNAREGPSQLEHDKPETFEMAAKLSKAKAKRTAALPSDHLNNIKHLQRRINSIGSMTDRKKNEFDPKAYPPVLFQREDVYKKALKETEGRPTRPKSAISRSLQTPSVASDDPDASTSLKRQLLEIIVEQRWVEDADLEALYDRTREAHRHLGEALVEDAISFVQYSLDNGVGDASEG